MYRRFYRRALSWVALCTLLSTASLAAAQADASCVPTCRRGFMCIEGACVSPCNPRCDAGEICTAEGECLSPSVVAPAAMTPSGPATIPPPVVATAPPTGAVAPHPWDPSSAQRMRLELGLRLAAAGKLKLQDGRFSDEARLAPTLGATVRFLLPVSEYFSLGPAVAFGAWKPRLDNDFEVDREFNFDLGGVFRGGYPFPLGSAGHGTAYGALGAGYSFLTLGEDGPLGREPLHGFHVGLVGGVQLTFGETFGIFAELGWVGHNTWFEGIRVAMNQMLMQLGFSLALGS